MNIKEMREQMAEAGMERGLGTLADFYDGLENIPAELLDRQWEFERTWANNLLSLGGLYMKLPCPDCKGSSYGGYNLSTCNGCGGLGYLLRPTKDLVEEVKDG